MASAARCDSDPGRLKLSSNSPPCETLSMRIAPATKIQAAMTRHGWWPAKWPMRYRSCDMGSLSEVLLSWVGPGRSATAGRGGLGAVGPVDKAIPPPSSNVPKEQAVLPVCQFGPWVSIVPNLMASPYVGVRCTIRMRMVLVNTLAYGASPPRSVGAADRHGAALRRLETVRVAPQRPTRRRGATSPVCASSTDSTNVST